MENVQFYAAVVFCELIKDCGGELGKVSGSIENADINERE